MTSSKGSKGPLMAMFANMSNGKSTKANGKPPESDPDDDMDYDFDTASKPTGKKKMSVERIYQKKTQLEHILLRPDTYIGSVEKLKDVSH